MTRQNMESNQNPQEDAWQAAGRTCRKNLEEAGCQIRTDCYHPTRTTKTTRHADRAWPVILHAGLGRCCRMDPSSPTSFLYHSSPDLWREQWTNPQRNSGRGGHYGFPTPGGSRHSFPTPGLVLGRWRHSQECPLREVCHGTRGLLRCAFAQMSRRP
ncbi:hypothetical protein BO70DRAFT_105340 [Aspergillus heteromorphus CBS 117.55]|uniref:Uncharacterized protein n=1 Tax=Aspergillus heteromorphus CBS 117.55 TaxID=1448321 RepID=A0A317VJ29_9EURO|nr:uncharacterized protein BO70DRAFT_105340 [Aspergillus heteromorphus CBS 117.55]PWY74374.1 hypothetical protein BO70DRAFT_105340 [Aspergillus heteromorphus CBS 117.55]